MKSKKIIPKIIFDDKGRKFILDALKKTTDKHGYVIDKKSKKYVLDFDGKKFKGNNFIGIYKKKWITNWSQFLSMINPK